MLDLLPLLLLGAAPAPPSPLRAMSPEAVRVWLSTPRGQLEAERALAVLWRQPRVGSPPTPPKFPFTPAQAKRYQADYARWAGLPVEVRTGIGLVLVLIPPGAFRMGSPLTEAGRDKDEEPFTATITGPLYLGKHEITVAQFREFVRATGHVTDGEHNGGGHAHDAKAVWRHREGVSWKKPGFAGPYRQRDDHPVVHVSHADAAAFCRWASARAGSRLRYSLPTEAQWEWACRAGSGGRFWWGDREDDTGKRLNLGDRSLKRIHPLWPRTVLGVDDGQAFCAPVGAYSPNAFGVHDMLGNVWEFCSTRSGPYPRRPTADPGDLDPKRGFAVRGGGWSNEVRDGRCAARNADPPRFCHSNLGFRAALPLP